MDLERRCWELGQKFSHISTINEVYRAEIDRLRDKVNRERGQHARDMEGLKRYHENMAKNVELDHVKDSFSIFVYQRNHQGEGQEN